MRKILIGLILMFAFPALSSAEDFTGTWKGSYYGSGGSSGNITIKLYQSGNKVRGTLRTSSGSKGKVSGTANGDVLKFSGKQTKPCSGSFKGTAVMEDSDTISYTVKASNCYGSERLAGEAYR